MLFYFFLLFVIRTATEVRKEETDTQKEADFTVFPFTEDSLAFFLFGET